MSQFYDQASLVMVPSGYKDGKLYSQKPLSTSGELAFSRGSDIEATRVNANGYIEKAQVNLLLQSNTFNTTWVKGGSLTSGQSGYDGSSNAWLYTTTAAGQRIEQSTTITGVQTISVYAKAGNLDWILLNIGGGVFGAYFDLANGVVGSTQSASGGVTIDTKIQAIGSGWYRISVSGNYSSASSFRIYTASADLVTAAGTVYIQDAQLNYGLVAQTYQETTTAAVVSGITDNMPRLNYDPANPTCPHLILEPSRSNIIADSEFFNNTSVWTQNPQITIDDNQDTSPEGVVNAARIYNNSGSETTIFYGASVNVGSAGTYTFSIFAKKGGLGWIRVRCLGFDAAANNNCWFDLENGVKGTNTFDEANIEDYGNGWFRISVKFTTSTDLTGTCYVYAADGDNDTTVASGASYYLSVYGAQLEAGSYPTSYIPTYGSSATRTADACSKTGISSLIGQTEGTLFFDFVAVDTSSFQIFEQIRTTGSTNVGQIDIRLQSGTIRALATDGGVSQFTIIGPSLVAGTRYKCAVRYEANNAAFYVNGASVGTDTSCSFTSSSLQQFSFNENASSFLPSAEINQAILFPTALSNADLATLTSL